MEFDRTTSMEILLFFLSLSLKKYKRFIMNPAQALFLKVPCFWSSFLSNSSTKSSLIVPYFRGAYRAIVWH